ncbi:MAG: carboxymuconolactone decarboxylase family protein [Anaerolineales bacterium]|nr:carboxymuconolactone decarboxylase family protein [Anaerolineales bacterium]
MDELRQAARGGRVSKAFAEKIMLAISQVNGCRYCLYGHSRTALAAGVSPDEVRQLLAGALGSFPEQEAVALAFAQHYAECQCRPDPKTVQRLEAFYGPEKAGDIQAYLRMITFGNLYGNTFDALLSRLRGRPAPGSSLGNELGVLFGVFVFVPLAMLRRRPAGRTRARPQSLSGE